MEVVRKLLTPLEIVPKDRRFNTTTNTPEYSPDGGTTWLPDEGADPRHVDAFRLPALSYDEARCDAAARMVATFQDHLVIYNASGDAAQFATFFMSAFLPLSGAIGIIISLALIAFDTLVEIGQANINAAFTPTVWESIHCIIYCSIDENGQMSEKQRDVVMQKIASAHAGVVYNVMINTVNLFGEVLLSNAGVIRTETGDCSECPACTWGIKFTPDADNGFYFIYMDSLVRNCANVAFGVRSPTSIVRAEGGVNTWSWVNAGVNGFRIYCDFVVPDESTLRSVYVRVGTRNAYNYTLLMIKVGSQCGGWNSATYVAGVLHWTLPTPVVGAQTVRIEITFTENGNSNLMYIPFVILYGTGVNPEYVSAP